MTTKTKTRPKFERPADVYIMWLHALAEEVARMLRNRPRDIGECKYAIEDAEHACGSKGWDEIWGEYAGWFNRPLIEAELIEIDGELCVVGLEYKKGRLVAVRAPLAASPVAA